MGRVLLVASLVVISAPQAFAQALGTLHISVMLTDGSGTLQPVARHALLISDDPPTISPRRIFTTLAGTADVSLRPGRYAVESDQPVAFNGKTYEWSQRIDIVAGRDATLELTAGNASIDTATATTERSAASTTDAVFLATRWQDAVAGLWTPTQHASGFLVDARGLIVTSQRVVGTAASVEVQFTPDLKVRATVLASDSTRDVAVLWVNPSVVASIQPLSLGCGQARPPVTNAQELYTIGAQMAGQKLLAVGGVTGVGPRLLLSDLRVARGTAGGPVFTADGLVGFTTVDDRDADGRSDSRVIRIDQACDVLASAEQAMTAAGAPDATRLPTDPQRMMAGGALDAALKSRAGSLSPYLMATTDFDITFVTPVHVYAAKDQRRTPLMDFGTWSEYMADYPRVLLVRVTPKMVEGRWAKLARGAAMTQGMSLPALKRAKAGFSRMHAFCGDAEVTPIHPFVVEQRVSETEAIFEGLYVFDPAALGPQCGTVKLTVYPESSPDRGDTRVVDPRVLEQIARDFEAL